MLIDFSNLPIPVDKRITTMFEQLLCVMPRHLHAIVLTIYPSNNNPNGINGLCIQFKWEHQTTLRMSLLMAFCHCESDRSKPEEQHARVTTISLCVDSLFFDTFYCANNGSQIPFFKHWQDWMLSDMEHSGIDIHAHMGVLPIERIEIDIARLGAENVTKQIYTLVPNHT